MLNQRQVAAYLLERELIRPEAIVAGDLAIESVSRRNSNFKVISRRGQCYLLKQGVGAERAATLAREAAVYELLQVDAAASGLRPYLPRYYGYDPQAHILILELVPGARDLFTYHARRGRAAVALAAATGDALGSLHRLAIAGARRFAQSLPWVLAIDCPDLGILQHVSRANLQLIEIVQRSASFCQLLAELRREWRAGALIHYDIKWDNCIVSRRSTARRKPDLKVVDWEFAGMGEPCWDVGAVFSNYLSFWLLSIPATGEAPPDRFIELARYPLEPMQPAIRAYWQAYCQRMALDPAASDRWLLRAARFAAARLVQTAFEQTQHAADLTGDIACLLQLSLNIMQRPHEAIVHLLGIPLPHARAA